MITITPKYRRVLKDEDIVESVTRKAIETRAEQIVDKVHEDHPNIDGEIILEENENGDYQFRISGDDESISKIQSVIDTFR